MATLPKSPLDLKMLLKISLLFIANSVCSESSISFVDTLNTDYFTNWFETGGIVPPEAPNSSLCEPWQLTIHLTALIDEIIVQFYTMEATEQCGVWLGGERFFHANHSSYTLTSGYRSRFIHTAKLYALRPGTLYQYHAECRCNNELFRSRTRQFRTQLGDGSKRFCFAAVADGNIPHSDGKLGYVDLCSYLSTLIETAQMHSHHDASRHLLELLRQSVEPIDLLLWPGDICYAYGDATESPRNIWDRFQASREAHASTVPWMFAIGNHETDFGEDRLPYVHRIPQPNNGAYYSFTYETLRVVMVDHVDHLYKGSAQHAWLEKELAIANRAENRAKHPWIVVLAHTPAYTSGTTHGNDPPVHTFVAPLLDRYGVDIYISGHEHNYERSWPIYNRKPTQVGGGSVHDPFVGKTIAEQGTRGTIYTVVGIGGQPLRAFHRPPKVHTAHRDHAFHGFARVCIEGTHSLQWQLVPTPNYAWKPNSGGEANFPRDEFYLCRDRSKCPLASVKLDEVPVTWFYAKSRGALGMFEWHSPLSQSNEKFVAVQLPLAINAGVSTATRISRKALIPYGKRIAQRHRSLSAFVIGQFHLSTEDFSSCDRIEMYFTAVTSADVWLNHVLVDDELSRNVLRKVTWNDEAVAVNASTSFTPPKPTRMVVVRFDSRKRDEWSASASLRKAPYLRIGVNTFVFRVRTSVGPKLYLYARLFKRQTNSPA